MLLLFVIGNGIRSHLAAAGVDETVLGKHEADARMGRTRLGTLEHLVGGYKGQAAKIRQSADVYVVL